MFDYTITNNAVLARVLGSLSHHDGPYQTYQFADAVIYSRRTGNRCGVPDDAVTYTYRLVGSDWEAEARAVWRRGVLYAPIATHTVFDYFIAPDSEPDLPQADLAERFANWAMGCEDL